MDHSIPVLTCPVLESHRNHSVCHVSPPTSQTLQRQMVAPHQWNTACIFAFPIVMCYFRRPRRLSFSHRNWVRPTESEFISTETEFDPQNRSFLYSFWRNSDGSRWTKNLWVELDSWCEKVSLHGFRSYWKCDCLSCWSTNGKEQNIPKECSSSEVIFA